MTNLDKKNVSVESDQANTETKNINFSNESISNNNEDVNLGRLHDLMSKHETTIANIDEIYRSMFFIEEFFSNNNPNIEDKLSMWDIVMFFNNYYSLFSILYDKLGEEVQNSLNDIDSMYKELKEERMI